MYIKVNDNPVVRILNTEHFADYCVINEDEGEWKVVASRPDGEHYVALGMYPTECAAEAVVDDIFDALVEGKDTFIMP